jgi:hypothetical protein
VHYAHNDCPPADMYERPPLLQPNFNLLLSLTCDTILDSIACGEAKARRLVEGSATALPGASFSFAPYGAGYGDIHEARMITPF